MCDVAGRLHRHARTVDHVAGVGGQLDRSVQLGSQRRSRSIGRPRGVPESRRQRRRRHPRHLDLDRHAHHERDAAEAHDSKWRKPVGRLHRHPIDQRRAADHPGRWAVYVWRIQHQGNDNRCRGWDLYRNALRANEHRRKHGGGHVECQRRQHRIEPGRPERDRRRTRSGRRDQCLEPVRTETGERCAAGGRYVRQSGGCATGRREGECEQHDPVHRHCGCNGHRDGQRIASGRLCDLFTRIAQRADRLHGRSGRHRRFNIRQHGQARSRSTSRPTVTTRCTSRATRCLRRS